MNQQLPLPTPSTFVPSSYQQAVFDFVRTGRGSANVVAVAGAGKTTTIVRALRFIPPTMKATFLAFNKKIAQEIGERLKRIERDENASLSHVRASTFHSAGYGAYRYFNKKVCEPNANKVRDLLDQHFGDEDVRRYGSFACKMVNLAKSAGVGALVPDDVSTWMGLSDHYDVYPDAEGADIGEGIEIARKLLALSVKAADDLGAIDFDDMLYMPLLRNVSFYKVDWLFVDEAQDTNQVQLALLRRMLKPNGRLIAVGDPRQAIYGFRGADAEAMNRIKSAFNCVELPLTISYRCAQSVVAKAQTIVSHIEASPTAPAGVVDETSVNPADVEFRNDDVIICRNTAPLVAQAYSFIGRGIGCKVLGREIGQGLVTLIRKLKAKSLDDLETKLQAYAAREIARFMGKGQEQKAQAVEDKVACIAAIANGVSEGAEEPTVDDVVAAIDSLFSDDSDKGLLTLCTAHKSKGLEWDRVFVLEPSLMPSSYARQQWQQEQEANLQYVAWTRAKLELRFLSVKVPPQKKGKKGT